MQVETSLLRETEQGGVYRAVFRDPDCTLLFTVTPEGTLGFDNRQPGARRCAGGKLSRALAEEMRRTARSRVPDALADRTQRGLARELRLHNRAWRLRVKPGHTVTAEIGGMRRELPDFDDNAVWFECPFRSLPKILKTLLSRG